ncbi:tyrosine-type recombinase/integrase [Lysinibacillus sp. NPDC097287]|uniref:tyrosine-type recombinase/integrase n=1 Tax=Lysinibacillus sp. NPDC097287 TaxID=3364144 RepID=UPI00382EF3E8
MDSLLENIEYFLKNSRLTKETNEKYLNRLNDFTLYLATLMNEKKEEIYLDKVYVEKDSVGVLIRYHPIDSALLDSYFRTLIYKGFSPMKSNHNALSSFFSFLEKNYNFKNPMVDIEFRLSEYTPEKKYSRVLTRGNIIKFFNAIVTNSKDLKTDLLLFCLLLSTGCRISEILDLQCKDIDFENDTFLLKKTKNNHQRIVNLRPGMGRIIETYAYKRNRVVTDFLFLNCKNNKLTRTDVDALLKEYLRLSNLPPINIHGFRHTFATLMADEDTPINFIQQMLGHKSIQSTKSYINPHYLRNKNLRIPENQLVLNRLKERLKIKSVERDI